MRTHSLFMGTLGFSLLIHALVLFAPILSNPQSDPPIESYRVQLVQKSIRKISSNKPKTSPVEATAQENVSPPAEAANPKPARQIEPKSDIAKTKTNQVIQRESKVEESNPHKQPDSKLEQTSTTSDFERQTSWSSRGIVTELQPEPPDDHQRMLEELRRLVKDRLQYPEVARRKGIEGTVIIALTVNTDGEAAALAVSASSGSRILDRAALKTISDILPLPDPQDTPLHFTIPVTYKLKGSR